MPIKINTQRELDTPNIFLKSSSYVQSSLSIESQFLQAMQAAGIFLTGEIIPDGKLHRFYIEGHKRGTKNGAYVLHLDGCPAGWFMDYTTGLSQTWKNSSDSRVSYALIKQIKEAKVQREVEIRQKHAEAAKKATYIWSQSKPFARRDDHQYLITKQIPQYGTRLYHKSLVIPIYDESDQLVNLQFIAPEGEKRFLKGGRKRGCFHVVGDISDKILICEGVATGFSLHEDSRLRVIIAFDAGNLLPVAKNIRELSPCSEIIICGDNDAVGQTKAHESALAIGAKALMPPIPGQDWNDYLTGGRHD